MPYIAGILIGFLSIHMSIFFLKQAYHMYFDFVAIIMVLGGTFGVGVATLPWRNIRTFFTSFSQVFRFGPPTDRSIIMVSLDYVKAVSEGRLVELTTRSIPIEILQDGKELMDLNFTTEDIQMILTERLHHYIEKRQTIADFFYNLAKFPPAFGLVGTVLGLVNLMRTITESADPAQTGIKMSLALIATLYGLLLANLIVAPIGDIIEKRNSVDRFHGEIALQAVLLAVDRVSLVKSQEMLNSFVARNKRIDILKSSFKTDESAA